MKMRASSVTILLLIKFNSQQNINLVVSVQIHLYLLSQQLLLSILLSCNNDPSVYTQDLSWMHWYFQHLSIRDHGMILSAKDKPLSGQA